MRKRVWSAIGLIGSFGCIYIYAKTPSFPTPDKLLLLAFFLGLTFNQAWETMKRLAPFIFLLAMYDMFRGVADYVNQNVNYLWMPFADKFMFLGQLPTKELQSVLWDGTVKWYDFALYITYMMHYVFPVLLAVLIWKLRETHYWRYVTTFVLVSFAGFATFLLFPAAPPWMASDLGLIEPIERVSSSVWFALGVQDFPSLYAELSPNPVAAVPSLHAAYATLLCLFIFQLFKTRWRYLSVMYPAAIYFGTVYMGEHYVIDELLGALYGVGAFYAAVPLIKRLGQLVRKIQRGIAKRIPAYSYIEDR